MKKVIKKHGKTVEAYRLGEANPSLDLLIREGLLRPIRNGTAFEVMSREAAAGGTGHGEVALLGDYIKIDKSGNPYPNSAAFFESNHIRRDSDSYEQLPVPLDAWILKEPLCEEIGFLLAHKGLTITSDPEHRFSAPLWGAVQSAPEDAVIVLYRVERDDNGEITDIDYGFVVREEFESAYVPCPMT